MLFPGQGSQYPGMLRDLACRFPAMHAALAEADDVPPGRRPPRERPDLSPSRRSGGRTLAGTRRALRATEVAQPALGAVSLGVLGVLGHFGVRPDAVAGHSYGELTALCAAGRIDARGPARPVAAPGPAHGRVRGGDGGAMLAVLAPLDGWSRPSATRASTWSSPTRTPRTRRSSPGPAEAIARAAELFGRLEVATRPLAVSAAFHSRFVAGARGPFLEALRDVAFAASPLPVFANTTGRPYPDDPDQARMLLAGQLAEPVEFVAMVEAMYRVGRPDVPRSRPGLQAHRPGRRHPRRDGARTSPWPSTPRAASGAMSVDLARALAQLAALGYPVHLPLWDEGVDARAEAARRPGLTVKVSGANPTPRPTPTPALEVAPTR